jgi:WD40 repeat protein
LWTVADGREQAPLGDHSSFVVSVVFSPDGKMLAAGSWEEASVWELSHTKARFRVSSPKGFVFGVALSADRKLLATAADDGKVKLWKFP